MARTFVRELVAVSLAASLFACTAPTAGPQGEVGPAGPTGPQGPQGQIGPMGPEGAAGGFGFIKDPYLEKGADKWNLDAATTELKTVSAADITGGAIAPPGGTSFFANLPNKIAMITSKTFVPVNTQRTYEVSGMFRGQSVGGAGRVSMFVRFFDADQAPIEGQDWNAAYNLQPPATWVTYSARLGAGTGVAIPAGAQFMTVGALLNVDVVNSTNGNSIYEATALSITPTTPPTPAKYAPVNYIGCNTTSPGGTGFWLMSQRSFTLDRPQYVTVNAKVSSSGTGYRYATLYIDTTYIYGYADYTEMSTSAAEQTAQPLMWTGLLGAGSHTVSLGLSNASMVICYNNTRMTLTFQDP